MDDMLTTDYDGCGRCLVGVRRLSRKTDKTSSPARQGDQILDATAGVGGHIIAWADDWEVSGATAACRGTRRLPACLFVYRADTRYPRVGRVQACPFDGAGGSRCAGQMSCR